ncbi:DUF485 domain-containing protein [Psychrobacillus soli]|uniref:DUF485 domain-containing protein n=1 Tax=Psychrobacillus soli TaxID=1543965 RepID=A0A544SQK3_9BACI|nr:DUF485 domain-containing protein [Psychrobacillus soli]TQR07482.1 DUF485 domain-containing protein [Psychrobacillus soli]
MAKKLESDFSPTATQKDKAFSEDEIVHTNPEVSTTPNYVAIAESTEFQSLKTKKRKFILPVSIFFLLCYIMLPILTSYTTILNRNAFGDVAWVWVYSIALFIMTWTLCMIYVRKANGYDREAEEIIEKEKAGGFK